ncbi:MAG: A/G-specific adenine glycosylase [Candidatus Marinimicrobia bacterium]|nr:A/G-specific adenine glycosylase [Candidatus Neomarinimicrobiota bacterium]
MHIPVPGRREKDPYAIWVAEVMLQQTQVTTVRPYYDKWMANFPDIKSLARAHEDQVLKIWEGLGYYSRARNLHKAAKLILSDHQEVMPPTSTELLKIPGIGPYTAAAVASIAYNEVVPLVDGNVLRVLSRIEMITDDISKAATKSKITEKLRALIPKDQPGAFNQSLMDLGRSICTPVRPGCPTCPVSQLCRAYLQGHPGDFPVKPIKKKTPHYHIVIGLIRRGDCFLIQKRPSSGLLGGLWEFPGGKIEAGESEQEALLREVREETSLTVGIGEKIGTIKHAYTHFKITLSAYFCDWSEGEARIHAATENRWVKKNQLNQYAFPKANLKILDLLGTN